jgi:ABC-2 type transport system permease protein
MQPINAATGGRLESIARPASAWQRSSNLLRELALTQFKLKYAGSALGYVWSLVKPMMLFGIMYLVFARLLGAGRNATEFPVQLLLGIVVWNFFTEATSTATSSIAASGHLIRKANFPRWILVIASTMTALLTFVINMTLVIIITVPLGHMHLSLRSALAPIFLIELVLLVIGLSLLLSALFVFFRDVGHIWEIISLVLFYGSAVVFPFTIIPAKDGLLRTLLGINPIAQLIEDLRHVLVTPDAPWMAEYIGGLYVVPILIVLSLFALGIVVFRRLTPRFAESL